MFKILERECLWKLLVNPLVNVLPRTVDANGLARCGVNCGQIAVALGAVVFIVLASANMADAWSVGVSMAGDVSHKGVYDGCSRSPFYNLPKKFWKILLDC